MSEKEERLVLAIIPPKERSETCPFCSTGEFWDMCSLYYKDGEADCDKCQEGVPRSEAIERMAKEMCKKIYGNPWGATAKIQQAYFISMAKTALDALISLPQNTSK